MSPASQIERVKAEVQDCIILAFCIKVPLVTENYSHENVGQSYFRHRAGTAPASVQNTESNPSHHWYLLGQSSNPCNTERGCLQFCLFSEGTSWLYFSLISHTLMVADPYPHCPPAPPFQGCQSRQPGGRFK